MYTQCPHCHTLFRIHPEHLNAAQGQVRCCLCDRTFNATEHLRTAPDPLIEASAEQPEQEQDLSRSATEPAPGSEMEEFDRPFQWDQTDTPPNTEFDLVEEQTLVEGLPETPSDSRALFGAGATADIDLEVDHLITPEIEIDQSLFKEPAPDESLHQERPPPSPEPTPFPTLEPVTEKPETVKMEAAGRDNSPSKPSEREIELPFDVPYGLPAIEPTPKDKLPVRGGGIDTRKKGGHRFIGSLAILILLLLAMVQLAWLGRDQLLEYPLARTLLQQICQLAECELPVRRDPGGFQVLDRSVGSHPEAKDALLVRLDFSNQASFAQPYPQILLSLFDDNEALAARRLFKPEEYLGRAQSGHSLLQPNQRVSVEMGLGDPGDTLTGFKFDFR